jgi:hypothetical protein
MFSITQHIKKQFDNRQLGPNIQKTGTSELFSLNLILQNISLKIKMLRMERMTNYKLIERFCEPKMRSCISDGMNHSPFFILCLEPNVIEPCTMFLMLYVFNATLSSV